MTKRKKILLVSAIALVIVLSSAIVAISAQGLWPTLLRSGKSLGYKDAVFGYDGTIYFFHDGELSSIGEGGDTMPKYAPLVSPDHKQILYQHSVYDYEDCVTMVIGVMGFDGKVIRQITIDNTFSNNIVGMEWLDNKHVGVTTHVNPSTGEYFIFDIVTGKEVSREVGYAFAMIPNSQNVIHAANLPHWSPLDEYHSFVVGEKTVYTVKDLNVALGTPVFDTEVKQVAFIEKAYLSDRESIRLIIADFDLDSLTLTPTVEIDVPEDVSGYLMFDENNQACFVNVDQKVFFNKDLGKFEYVQIENDLIVTQERYPDLFGAIKEKFGFGNSETKTLEEEFADIMNVTMLP